MRIFIFCTLGTNGLSAWPQKWIVPQNCKPAFPGLICRAGHLRYFLIFSLLKKWFFAFFKLIWQGLGFLNRTGAEIGYWLEKMCKNTESAQLCIICKENGRFWHSLLWALGINGLKRTVFSAFSFFSLKLWIKKR